MHNRNIYKTPPDYTELAIKYPNFRKVCTLQLDGKVSLNFKNEEALKQLSQTLLQNDFNLIVNFPKNHLVPTIPLRLNYILWLEDLFNEHQMENIHGIDIGCGATSIYCLLAAKKNGWKMTGIETQLESARNAEEIVKNNNLENSINIYHQENLEKIFENLFEKNERIYDFCLCNPPFYDSQLENSTNIKVNQRKRKRKAPNNVATGNQNELFCCGGEEKFITQIISESLNYKNRVKIFSSMLGHKKNITTILNVLAVNRIENFIQTTFCQGKTTRWAVAWSFENTVNLEKCKKYCIEK